MGSSLIARITKREWVTILGFALLWLLGLSLMRPWGDFPVNDDWIYGETVHNILRHGRFQFYAPASANFFLQAYWGALFCALLGFSYTTLKLSTVIAGLGGIAALYLLVRETGARRGFALLAVLTLALNPMYMVLTASFLTDVPFLSLVTVALWLFVRGLNRERPICVAGAFLALFAALLIRQHALLFIIGLGVALALKRRFSFGGIVILAGTTLGGIAIQLLYQHWLITTDRTPKLLAGDFAVLLPAIGVLKTIAVVAVKGGLLIPYVGLIAAPMLLFLRFDGLRRLWRAYPLRTGIAFELLVLFQAVLVIAFHLRMPYYGNMLMPYGIGPLTLRDIYLLRLNQPPVGLFWTVAWQGAMMLGIVAGSAILVEVWAIAAGAFLSLRTRADDALEREWLPVLAAVIVIIYLTFTGLLTLRHNAFDRYLLPLIPPLALFAGWQSTRSDRRPELFGPVLVLAFLTAFGIIGGHDYFAFLRAREPATEALERAGIAPNRIDGGYEYGRRLGAITHTAEGLSYWANGNDFVIASGPLRGYAIIARYPYPRWLSLDTAEVVTLRRTTGPIDPETEAGAVPRGAREQPAPCPLWLAGVPVCPHRELVPAN